MSRENSGLKRREHLIVSSAAGESSKMKTKSCAVYSQHRNHR